MGGAGWFNLIPQLPDFAGAGLNWALGGMANNRYKESVRHLRRREYQDMVFSLKQAGLNPALAYGASPGHAPGFQQQVGSSAGSAGIANAMASLEQADIAGQKAPSEINLNSAQAALKEQMRLNEVFRRGGILQEFDKNAAWIEQTLQAARTSAAQQGLYEAQMKQAGANTDQIRETTSQINRFGLPGQSWTGGIRAALADPGTASAVLAPITGIDKGRWGNLFEGWGRPLHDESGKPLPSWDKR